MVTAKIKRVRESLAPLPLPSYQSERAAGMDLMADVDAPLILAPGKRALVPTGLAIELPDGFEAQVRPRSGLAAKKGLTLVNSPGTIDADYRGEILAAMINLGEEPVHIERGERIAQMVVSPVVQVVLTEVEELSDTKRRGGGFGSTGRGLPLPDRK